MSSKTKTIPRRVAPHLPSDRSKPEAKVRDPQLAVQLKQKAAIAVARREVVQHIKEESEAQRLERLELNRRKIEWAKTHRELIEDELREALFLAKDKRPTATYRDLVDTADKFKKHLNIIDGIGQEPVERVIIVPSSLAERFGKKPIEGECTTV